MKKKILLPVALVAAVVVAAVAFMGGGTSKYLNAIPDNSLLMAKVNVGNLVDDSDVLNNSTIKSLVSLASGQLTEEYKKLVDEVMKDPSNFGINVDEPVVFAMIDEHRMIVTAAVSDRAALTRNLNLFADAGIRISEEGGLTYVETYEEESALAYNDNMLVFIADQRDLNSKYDINEYFDYQMPKAVDNPKYDHFFSQNDDAALFVDMGGVFKQINEQMGDYAYDSSLALYAEMYKDISFMLDLNFGDGNVSSEVEILGSNEYIDALKNIWAAPSKKHLKYIPSDALAVATVAMDLDAVQKLLPAEMDVNAMLSYFGLDSSVFKSLSGDYTFAMLPVELQGREKDPQFMVIVDCTDRKIFDMLIDTFGDEISGVDSDVYSLNANRYYDYYSGSEYKKGYDYYLMYKENAIFFVPENVYDNMKSGNGIEPLAYNIASDETINGITCGGVFYLSRIVNEIIEEEGANHIEDEAMEFLRMLDNLVLDIPSLTNAKMQLNLENKSENILKQVLDTALQTMM